MTDRFANRRIVVAGDRTEVQRLIDAPGADHLARIRPSAIPPPAFDSLHALLTFSMKTFERRVTAEAEHESWIAGGSIVHDYADLRRSLERSEIRPKRDAAFARRYVDALEALCVRHARTRYSLFVHVGGTGDCMIDRMVAATGVPRLDLTDSGSGAASWDLITRPPGAVHV